jgi:hypothetical protein
MSDDELLSPRQTGQNEALKADLLTRTTRRIRGNVWRRRAVQTLGGLSCFGLGAATTYMHRAPAVEVVYVEVPSVAPIANAPGSMVPAKREPRKLSPPELELAAEQIRDKSESARRFREAGDRYLRDFADYRAALRCYRNFLDEADAADRAVSADDTWLLTSLKRAREQESTQ